MKAYQHSNIKISAFIDRMDLAYNAADVIISRAGASTISELFLVGKAAILVPSPNVAEDHQTKNAIALAERKAALMVHDRDARDQLFGKALQLLKNEPLRRELGANCNKMALPDATSNIVDEIFKLGYKHIA
jgi:UDP-N-acetylglucosamine--N-acetylmuramyl-(pentapeptide) pyrophosphoryl-undecaprenol N-acetylglucosamine transferase